MQRSTLSYGLGLRVTAAALKGISVIRFLAAFCEAHCGELAAAFVFGLPIGRGGTQPTLLAQRAFTAIFQAITMLYLNRRPVKCVMLQT